MCLNCYIIGLALHIYMVYITSMNRKRVKVSAFRKTMKRIKKLSQLPDYEKLMAVLPNMDTYYN